MKPIAALIVLGLTFAVVGSAGCDKEEAPTVVRRPGEPDYVRPKDDDLMNRAIAKARQTQSTFVAALERNDPKLRGFSIKKGFPTPRGGLEHIWLTDPKWDGQRYTGEVNNEPVETTAVKLGQRVPVTGDELSDWMYVDKGTLVGGYTIRALHFEESPEEQKKFTEQTGLTIPPIDF